MEVKINGIVLRLAEGDITLQDTEAIVNAANSGLMGGGGVDGAIHRAGGPAILEACKQIVAKIGRLPTGRAVITAGGNLKAKYVIHTVGPVWQGGGHDEPALLASAYTESLQLAAQHHLRSISFPSISTGAYGYPLEEAAEVALGAVREFLEVVPGSIKEVVFVLYGRRAYDIYSAVLKEMARPD
jgi:O-acetyl-ADP-ribose deacetylase